MNYIKIMMNYMVFMNNVNKKITKTKIKRRMVSKNNMKT